MAQNFLTSWLRKYSKKCKSNVIFWSITKSQKKISPFRMRTQKKKWRILSKMNNEKIRWNLEEWLFWGIRISNQPRPRKSKLVFTHASKSVSLLLTRSPAFIPCGFRPTKRSDSKFRKLRDPFYHLKFPRPRERRVYVCVIKLYIRASRW